jgi:hypothetical protein
LACTATSMRSPAAKETLMDAAEHSRVIADTAEQDAIGCRTPFFRNVYLSNEPAALGVESATKKLVTLPATGIGIWVRTLLAVQGIVFCEAPTPTKSQPLPGVGSGAFAELPVITLAVPIPGGPCGPG